MSVNNIPAVAYYVNFIEREAKGYEACCESRKKKYMIQSKGPEDR